MFAKLVSDMMIAPGKSPVFGAPREFGLVSEDVAFQAADGVTLRGWLIKGRSDKIIIQSHFGVQCSRSGYTPKGKGLIKMASSDISFLRQARYLNEQGYSVLMFDMRNHGESDSGSCPWVSWGPEEAKDIVAAVNFVSSHEGYGNAKIGLLSICMGAAASTYAYGMGQAGLSQFGNIQAMIAVQPLHYKEFVRAFGIPSFLSRSGNRLSYERLGFDLESKTFMDDVEHIDVPTLVVQNRNDPWTDLAFVQQYHDRLNVEKELLWLDLDKTRAAAYDYLGTNPKMLTDYFGRYM